MYPNMTFSVSVSSYNFTLSVKPGLTGYSKDSKTDVPITSAGLQIHFERTNVPATPGGPKAISIFSVQLSLRELDRICAVLRSALKEVGLEPLPKPSQEKINEYYETARKSFEDGKRYFSTTQSIGKALNAFNDAYKDNGGIAVSYNNSEVMAGIDEFIDNIKKKTARGSESKKIYSLDKTAHDSSSKKIVVDNDDSEADSDKGDNMEFEVNSQELTEEEEEEEDDVPSQAVREDSGSEEELPVLVLQSTPKSILKRRRSLTPPKRKLKEAKKSSVFMRKLKQHTKM